MKTRVQRLLSGLLACCLVCTVLTWNAEAAGVCGFRDVPANHWAASSIQRCVELGLFQGESATTFGVGHEMNRAGFTVVLARLFGWETTGLDVNITEVYEDVPANAWYAGAVAAAYTHGALTRQSASFRPDEPITREELAVMLVRAMGYGTLAGLAQDLAQPFRDVTTNTGYIAMAYELGLVSGTTATTFSPERTATREQTAVILMRLYDKLHAAAPGKIGIVASAEEAADLTGFDAVALTAGQLVYQSGGTHLTATSAAADAAAVRTAAESAGAALLYRATGSEGILRGDPGETAAIVAAAAAEYDGVLLDLQTVSYQYRKNLTALVTALDTALGEKTLYVTVQAPSQDDPMAEEGYDYTALAALADGLIVRVDAYEGTGSVPIAPMEPLEAVYYAMSRLSDTVAPEKLVLQLTTTASVWTDGKRDASVTGAQAAQWAESGALREYYSSEYACAYLSGTMDKQERVVWYLNGDAVKERTVLAACFGINQVCLTSLEELWPGLLEALE